LVVFQEKHHNRQCSCRFGSFSGWWYFSIGFEFGLGFELSLGSVFRGLVRERQSVERDSSHCMVVSKGVVFCFETQKFANPRPGKKPTGWPIAKACFSSSPRLAASSGAGNIGTMASKSSWPWASILTCRLCWPDSAMLKPAHCWRRG